MKIRSDFVTNSSSSCFVVNTGEDVDQVKEALVKILLGYQIMTDNYHRYKEVFREPFVYTEEKYLEHLHELDCADERRRELNKENPRGKLWPRWSGWDYESEETIGKVLIMSASDNSIPWDICDIIATRFNTVREHLG